MITTELTCQELVELVTHYLEGALSEDDRRRFDRHLDRCPGCVTYLDQLRVTIRLTGRLRQDDVDPVARDALLARFRDWRRSPA